MKYKAKVKSRCGCYWWLDKASFENGTEEATLRYNADSDEEALYIAALTSCSDYDDYVARCNVISAIKIVNFENCFCGSRYETKTLEYIMDHPTECINSDKIRLSKSSPYFLDIVRVESASSDGIECGPIIWQDPSMKSGYTFPESKVYTAWCSTWDDMHAGKLISKSSRRFYAPSFDVAPLGAAFKLIYTHTVGDKLCRSNEPTKFTELMYNYSRETLWDLYYKVHDRLSETAPYRLYLSLIQDGDGNIFWKNDNLKTKNLVIPDRESEI